MRFDFDEFWKEIRTSKTVLFNSAAALAVLVPELQESLPILQQVLPADYYGLLLKVVVGGNLVLRIWTKVTVALESAAFRP